MKKLQTALLLWTVNELVICGHEFEMKCFTNINEMQDRSIFC